MPLDALGALSTPAARRDAFVGAFLSSAVSAAFADTSSLDPLAGEPVVVVAPHLCSLDAAAALRMAFMSSRLLRLAVAPVLLQRYSPLSRFGAFPVTRGDSLRSAGDLRTAGRWLAGSVNGMVWFFPQGGHVRLGADVECERGVLAVALAAKAPVVPVSIHYEMFQRGRPAVWLKTGEPRWVRGIGPLNAVLAGAHEQLLADLRDGTGDYRPMTRSSARLLLLQNVPCARARLEAALAVHGLPVSLLGALESPAVRLTVEQRAAFVAAVADREGPFHGQLIERTLDINHQ